MSKLMKTDKIQFLPPITGSKGLVLLIGENCWPEDKKLVAKARDIFSTLSVWWGETEKGDHHTGWEFDPTLPPAFLLQVLNRCNIKEPGNRKINEFPQYF